MMKSHGVWLSLVVTLGLGFVPVRAQDQVQAYQPGPGIENPKIVRMVQPRYTPQALRAKIQGEVEIEAVVGTDGVPSHVRVVRSLDSLLGLDDKAVAAAQQWVFQPGTRNGKPVPVVVRVVLQYKLADELGHVDDSHFLEGVYQAGPDVQLPVALSRVEPRYTSDALRQRIQGQVVVEAVVGVDGTVTRARVQQSLDAGLDEEALTAVSKWTFQPGSVRGTPEAVLVRLNLDFRIH